MRCRLPTCAVRKELWCARSASPRSRCRMPIAMTTAMTTATTRPHPFPSVEPKPPRRSLPHAAPQQPPERLPQRSRARCHLCHRAQVARQPNPALRLSANRASPRPASPCRRQGACSPPSASRQDFSCSTPLWG